MENPIRVLCVFSTLDRGGAESMCMNLYRHIDRTKVQFDFVKHTTEKGAFEEEITALGGRIFSAPRYKVYNHLIYTKWWANFLDAHPEYQIIHGHFFGISSVYFREAQKKCRVTIGHSHCTHSDKKSNKNRIKDFYINSIEKYSDYCFACSQPAGEWIFPKKEFKVLNNAIDTELYRYQPEIRTKVRKESNIEDNFVIGTVGRIMHQKNPDGIIDIFAAIRNKQPRAKLMWIGNGPDREAAEARIKNMGIQDSVMMMGVRSDVNELMQAMDVFILPSFFEGLPVVAIEAQTAGLRCILSDTIAEEVEITGRCEMLPIDNTELWAERILNTKCDHADTQQQIIDVGYDIHQTAEWLTAFYCTAYNKRQMKNEKRKI